VFFDLGQFWFYEHVTHGGGVVRTFSFDWHQKADDADETLFPSMRIQSERVKHRCWRGNSELLSQAFVSNVGSQWKSVAKLRSFSFFDDSAGAHVFQDKLGTVSVCFLLKESVSLVVAIYWTFLQV
jgi:hypothetical protein